MTESRTERVRTSNGFHGDRLAVREAESPASRRLSRGYFKRLFSGEVINKALRFAAAAVLARALSASEFGLVNVGIAVAGIAVTLGSLGLSEVGARELARSPDRAPQLAGQVLVARLAAFVVLFGAGVGVAAIWYPHADFTLVVGGMTLIMLVTGEWFARGLEQMGTVARGTVAGGLTALVAACVVAAVHATVVTALLGFVAAEFVAASAYWHAARGRRPRFGIRGVRALVTGAAPVAVSVVALYAFYANLDTIILASARSAAEAGYYSAAYRVFLALNVVAIFTAYANYALVARLQTTGDVTSVIEWLTPSLRSVAAYGAAVVGVVALAGDDILQVCFGQDFAAADTAFLLLTISTAWYCVGYVIGYSFVAAGYAPRFTLGAAIAGVSSVALALLLIPPMGMEGAAAATTVAIILATLVWVGKAGIRVRDLRITWILLGLVTLVGAAGAMWPDVRAIAGVVSIAGAAAVVPARRHQRGRRSI